MTYESTKQVLVKFQGSDSPTSPLSVVTAGGICGLVSWACVCTVTLHFKMRKAYLKPDLPHRLSKDSLPEELFDQE